MRPGLPPPSAMLGWLQQAEAARRRCKSMLPKQWLFEVDGLRAVAAPAKAWLQHLQQQGDRWLQVAPAVQQELNAAGQALTNEGKDPDGLKKKLTCSGCGKCALQLSVCGACREAQYCR